MGNHTLSTTEALDKLSQASTEAETAYQDKREAVLSAHAAGATWREICETAGITRPTGIRWAREAEGGR